MKKMTRNFAVTLVTLLFTLIFDAYSNIEAMAANYSSNLGDKVVISYWPIGSTTITSKYGRRILNGKSECHNEIDILASLGTGIYAAADGVVIYARYSSSAGNYVLIEHPDGRRTKYCHLSKILVKEKQTVKTGTKIGLVRYIGRAYGSHLDFQVYDVNGERIDPKSVTVKTGISYSIDNKKYRAYMIKERFSEIKKSFNYSVRALIKTRNPVLKINPGYDTCLNKQYKELPV